MVYFLCSLLQSLIFLNQLPNPFITTLTDPPHHIFQLIPTQQLLLRIIKLEQIFDIWTGLWIVLRPKLRVEFEQLGNPTLNVLEVFGDALVVREFHHEEGEFGLADVLGAFAGDDGKAT